MGFTENKKGFAGNFYQITYKPFSAGHTAITFVEITVMNNSENKPLVTGRRKRSGNLIIEKQGGISCVDEENEMIIGLPVAGLMTDEDGYDVALAYTNIDRMAKSLGSRLSSPFMTLSFMALLVIPDLKLSDLGLFNGQEFRLI